MKVLKGSLKYFFVAALPTEYRKSACFGVFHLYMTKYEPATIDIVVLLISILKDEKDYEHFC